jgi:Tfp pilus assembly protein PilO
MRLSLKRVFHEKRRLVIPIAAGLALNIVLYAGVVYPLSVRERSGEQRDRAAAAELQAAEREALAARETVQGRARTESALKAFYHDVLPGGLSNARLNLYSKLSKLAEEHNLERGNLRLEPDKNLKGSLVRLRGMISLHGDYEDIREFIYQVESGPEFVVIDSVTLTQGGEPGSSSLTLTLGLSTYYRPKYGA